MASATLRASARTAQLFHALSDETRLQILGRLIHGERCVCDLTDALDAAQSRLSFHLKVLKTAGLVTDRREGRWSYYALNPGAFAEAQSITAAFADAAARAEAPDKCC
ncbi:MAG: winged helix-turn-helix transcriptional regulator [Gemmatimonadales bacterium]|nr:winged helix-turn-helix transcriptional regulator [Gemmatimonadales bacterium]